MKGLMSIGSIIAQRFGLGELWAGDDGFEGVLRQKLSEMGVPQRPIELTGPRSMTVRQMAEQSGFIRKPRRQRRVK
jgi:hypothetical protein